METKKVQHVLSEGTIYQLKVLAVRRSVTQSDLLTLLIGQAWRAELPAIRREAKRDLEDVSLVAELEEKA